MPDIRYLQLDVFPASAGGGNPLGVVIDAVGWSDADMQRFATWTGLVETTFLQPPSTPEASYRVRIFTPQREIPFAGHPSIGSAHAALEAGLVQPVDGRLLQECGAGLLPIRVEMGAANDTSASRQLFVQAPSARVLRTGIEDEPKLCVLLDSIELGALPPAFVEGGRRWWLAEFANEKSVREWRPDHAAIAALAKDSDSLGLCVFARIDSAHHQLVVRAFPAGVGIVEDPASGAANGLIAAYIAAREPQGALAHGYTVSQGREIAHDARIVVHIDDETVWVGGRTDTVVSGTLQWPLQQSLQIEVRR